MALKYRPFDWNCFDFTGETIMDDYGNDFMSTDVWKYECEEYSYSMATFGMLDDAALDSCLQYAIPYWKQDI